MTVSYLHLETEEKVQKAALLTVPGGTQGVGIGGPSELHFLLYSLLQHLNYLPTMIPSTIKKNKHSKINSSKLTTFWLSPAICFSLLLKHFLNREGDYCDLQSSPNAHQTLSNGPAWASLFADDETEAQGGW